MLQRIIISPAPYVEWTMSPGPGLTPSSSLLLQKTVKIRHRSAQATLALPWIIFVRRPRSPSPTQQQRGKERKAFIAKGNLWRLRLDSTGPRTDQEAVNVVSNVHQSSERAPPALSQYISTRRGRELSVLIFTHPESPMDYGNFLHLG